MCMFSVDVNKILSVFFKEHRLFREFAICTYLYFHHYFILQLNLTYIRYFVGYIHIYIFCCFNASEVGWK